MITDEDLQLIRKARDDVREARKVMEAQMKEIKRLRAEIRMLRGLPDDDDELQDTKH